jgi:hypothetical protein
VPQKEQGGQGHHLRLWTAYENPLQGVLKNQHVTQAKNWKCLLSIFIWKFLCHLNTTLPQRWIGCTSKCNKDAALIPWPPRSPDLIPCDFFLWGYVKDKLYVACYQEIYHSFNKESWLQLIPLMFICCNMCGKS